MKDIYNTLAKFLDGEADPQEKALVQEYKLNNAQEFARLQALWNKKHKVKLSEFDSAEGWKQVKTGAVKTATRSDSSKLKRRATIIAFLLLLLLGSNYLLHLQKKAPVQFAEMIGAYKGEEVALDDGSIVYLNKGASLKYPKTFDGETREIVIVGEAFFEVHRDVERPFIVHTPHSNVEVLGTSFNIDTDGKETKVAVATGKVRVENIASNKSEILIKNQSATINHEELAVFKTVDVNYLSWKTGIFRFENTDLYQVIKDLESFYGHKIRMIDNAATCSFTSSFDNHDPKEIAEIIQLSCGLQLTEKNGSYELH